MKLLLFLILLIVCWPAALVISALDLIAALFSLPARMLRAI